MRVNREPEIARGVKCPFCGRRNSSVASGFHRWYCTICFKQFDNDPDELDERGRIRREERRNEL